MQSAREGSLLLREKIELTATNTNTYFFFQLSEVITYT